MSMEQFEKVYTNSEVRIEPINKKNIDILKETVLTLKERKFLFELSESELISLGNSCDDDDNMLKKIAFVLSCKAFENSDKILDQIEKLKDVINHPDGPSKSV